jgi:hypothetical protein
MVLKRLMTDVKSTTAELWCFAIQSFKRSQQWLFDHKEHNNHMLRQSKIADRSNLKFNHEGAIKRKQSVAFFSWPGAVLVDELAVWFWCRFRNFSSSSKIKTTYVTLQCIFKSHAYFIKCVVWTLGCVLYARANLCWKSTCTDCQNLIYPLYKTNNVCIPQHWGAIVNHCCCGKQ